MNSAIHKFAKSLARTFYERCGVGFLDMSYPSNRATFGKWIPSTPSVMILNVFISEIIKNFNQNLA